MKAVTTPLRIRTIASVTITDDARSRVMKKALVAPTASPSRRQSSDEHGFGIRQKAARQDVARRHRDAAKREIERQDADAERLAENRNAERRGLTQDQHQQEGLQQVRPQQPGADEQRRRADIGDRQAR